MKHINLEIEFWNISDQAKRTILEDIEKDLMQLYEKHKTHHTYDRIRDEEHIKYEIDFKKD